MSGGQELTGVVLRTEGLTKRFGGLVAVDDVSLVVRQQEVHALIGPNGAGKSTLANLLTGHLAPDLGRVVFRDRDITGMPPNRVSQIGIGRSYQRTNIFPNFTCYENCWLAAQSRLRNSFRLFLRGHLRGRVETLANRGLELCGLANRSAMVAGSMSYGEQRQLEIGMVLATEPEFLVLDEPMAGMGPEESRRVIELLGELKKDYPLVLIEHDMDAVFQLADTLTVMASGKVLATGSLDTVRNDPFVQQAYLGEGSEDIVALVNEPVDGAEQAPSQQANGDGLLSAQELHTYYGESHILHGISFEMRRGETVSLMGRNGMGKTTTLRSILGLAPVQEGRVLIKGRDVTRAPTHEIIREGIAYVPEGRGIFQDLTVHESLVMPARRGPDGRDDWTLERVLDLFPRLRERSYQMAGSLSGGEQQMLAIGRALMTNPDLLILDEATEGLAPLIRREIWGVIRAIKETGIASLIVDKNVDVLLDLCDRSLIMVKGTIVFDGSTRELRETPDLVRTHIGL